MHGAVTVFLGMTVFHSSSTNDCTSTAQPTAKPEASTSRVFTLRCTTRSVGGWRASTRSEQCRLSSLSAAPKPGSVAASCSEEATLFLRGIGGQSSSESLLSLKSPKPWPVRWARTSSACGDVSPRCASMVDAALSAGLLGAAVLGEDLESSAGTHFSILTLAMLSRFIISSQFSFFSGSTSLSGWCFSDIRRQARVISFAWASAATPKTSWSASSQMVVSRRGSVLKPFCLLSMDLLSQKTFTHAT
mmetsp:Transcript_36121/g.93163  ORF Transcript_36121/g.93163 Transcript_36121/m.93163 type:complete len:247 (-) Transcript_36121:2408-3148(-)